MPDDPDVADAMTLSTLPGWTWRDLQETPARVIDALRVIRTETAAEAARRARG